MGHAPRQQGAGLTYHVTARGNDRQPIFDDDRDRRSFLALVEKTRERRAWRIHAWCLMTNHIHLLVTTDEPTLSDGLRDIIGLYARRYNRLHDRTGHLFSARFRSVMVTTDEQFLTAVRYVNRNPVRAGMIEHPEHYPWSGYGLRTLPRPPVGIDEAEVLGRLHPLREIAERQLYSLVHAEVAPARTGNPRPTVGTLVQAMGRHSAASAAVAAGYRQHEVATTLGVSASAVSKRVNRRAAGPDRETGDVRANRTDSRTRSTSTDQLPRPAPAPATRPSSRVRPRPRPASTMRLPPPPPPTSTSPPTSPPPTPPFRSESRPANLPPARDEPIATDAAGRRPHAPARTAPAGTAPTHPHAPADPRAGGRVRDPSRHAHPPPISGDDISSTDRGPPGL